jgi:hypothetical protein
VRRFLKGMSSTLELMLYCLLPIRNGAGSQGGGGGAVRCTPRQFGRGVDGFLDSGGNFEVFLPDCWGLAAPLVLFRLKRQGYSRCSVQATGAGLHVEGRR